MITLFSRGVVGALRKSLYRWRQRGGDIWGGFAGSQSQFGANLSISEDGLTIAIYAPNRTQFGTNLAHGSISVHRFNGQWQMIGQELLAENSQDAFGASLALSSNGNRLVACAPNFGANNYGKLYVYDYDGSQWQLSATIGGTSSIEADFCAINGNGNRIAISTSSSGSVYEFNGASWVQLGSSFTGGSASLSLSKDGTRVVVGRGQIGTGIGAILFEFSNGNWNTVNQFSTYLTTRAATNANGTQVMLQTGSGIDVLQQVNGSWQQMGDSLDFSTQGFTLINPNTGVPFFDQRIPQGSFSWSGRLLVHDWEQDNSVSTSELIPRHRAYDFQNGNWAQVANELKYYKTTSSTNIPQAISGDGKTVAFRQFRLPNSALASPSLVVEVFKKELN